MVRASFIHYENGILPDIVDNSIKQINTFDWSDLTNKSKTLQIYTDVDFKRTKCLRHTNCVPKFGPQKNLLYLLFIRVDLMNCDNSYDE